jgi:hypothetical protein
VVIKNIQLSHWKHWNKTDIKVLINLRNSGLNYNEISRRTGRTVFGIRRMLQINKTKIKNYCLTYEEIYKLPNINLDKNFIIYLSAFLDGEGSLSLRGRGSSGIRPTFNITNTYKPVMIYIYNKLKFLNCQFSVKDSVKKTKNWSKVSYRINMSGVKVVALCKVLLPFLIVKKEKAKLIIKWWKFRSKSPIGMGYSSKEYQLQKKMKQLNKKGLRLI